MSMAGRLTPAERRLAVLLFALSLLGYAARWGKGVSPEVASWLREDSGSGGPVPPADPGPESGMPPDSAGPGTPDPGPPASPAGDPGEASGLLVDPNRADLTGLQELPGVGPVLARRILEDRTRRGPFRSPEDLLRVSGIGPATLARIRPFLRMEPTAGGRGQPAPGG